MRYSLLVIFTFCVNVVFAQTPPEFNASNTAGIFYYNVDDVIKEVRIKKDKHKTTATKALRAYNSKVKKLSFLNSFKFRELNVTMNAAYKNLASLGTEQRQNLKLRLEEVIKPVRDTLEIAEKKLNTTFEEMLSKKQLKKWKRYQRSEKKKLLPEQKPDPNQRPPQSMQNRGRGMRRF